MTTTTLKVTGTLLASGENDRSLTYLLLPFGEAGSTNLGKVTASAGAVEIPADPGTVLVNREHVYQDVLGKAANIEETEQGLVATLHAAETTAGNDWLTEAREGLRACVSVELENVVIRAGALVKATLTGIGAVVKPAYPSAQLIAADFGELEDPEDPEKTDEEIDPETGLPIEKTPKAPSEAETEEETESSDEEEKSELVANAAPAQPNGTKTLKTGLELIAQAYSTRDQKLVASLTDSGAVGEDNLFAALSPITSTANTANVEQSAWLGELWSGKTYTRKYAPLVNSGSLTSWKVEGWKFVNKPVVGDYAGDLAAIPSNAVSTVHYSEEAERLAGGWKLDRKYRDFGNTEFITSFFNAATEDYARKSDAKVLEFIDLNATAVEGGAVPANVNEGMARIIDGVLAMIDFATPSAALVAPDVYRSILLTREDDSLKYLSSALGFEDGSVGQFRLIPSAELAAGEVIVLAKEAVTLFELPSTPIRVSALDIANGGEDEAIFGYYALVLNDARGIVNVTPYVP